MADEEQFPRPTPITTERIIEDVKKRQRNYVFPDTLRNSRGVDEAIFKGSPDAPMVQRIGVALWGLAFICFGIAIMSHSKGSGGDIGNRISNLVSLGFILLGAMVVSNALRKHSKTKQKPTDDPATHSSHSSPSEDIDQETNGRIAKE